MKVSAMPTPLTQKEIKAGATLTNGTVVAQSQKGLLDTLNMESLAWKGDTPDDWKYCFAQTIVYSDAAYVIPANNAFAMSPDHKFSAGLYLPTGPDTGLDSGFPYLGKTYNSGDREEIGDSPGLPIYNGDGATIYHIQAVTYYMCQPVDSLGNPTGGWVPVASLFWSYTVIARWNGTKTPIIYSDAEVFDSDWYVGHADRSVL